MRRRERNVFLGAVGLLLLACGTRTGLLIDESFVDTDAGKDAGKDARKDVQPDVLPDVVDEDSPGFDASKPDVIPPNDCPDAGSTLVYLITEQGELVSFYPPTLTFKTIGTIACPNPNGNTPFSMGVNRTGTAYVVWSDGRLFEVSTATASCKATSFKVNQQGFNTFGMGYSGDNNGENLFVAESTFNTPSSKGLGIIDTKTFILNFVSAFSPPIPRSELTGTGDGRLFAYWPNTQGSGGHIAQIDPKTAQVNGVDNLAIGGSNDAFAFAFWGGVFWVFTSPSGPSTVTKFDPQTLSETNVTTYSGTIVGAGVSTCAPQ
jgi:hypothetical protein